MDFCFVFACNNVFSVFVEVITVLDYSVVCTYSLFSHL